MWRTVAPALALLLALPLVGCTPRRTGSDVVVSFYPLQYVATRIVGSHAHVVDLTRPGVEPHDLELRPTQIATVAAAKVAFYEKGLQPAVDEAVAQEAPERALDVSAAADLDLTFPPIESGEQHDCDSDDREA